MDIDMTFEQAPKPEPAPAEDPTSDDESGSESDDDPESESDSSSDSGSDDESESDDGSDSEPNDKSEPEATEADPVEDEMDIDDRPLIDCISPVKDPLSPLCHTLLTHKRAALLRYYLDNSENEYIWMSYDYLMDDFPYVSDNNLRTIVELWRNAVGEAVGAGKEIRIGFKVSRSNGVYKVWTEDEENGGFYGVRLDASRIEQALTVLAHVRTYNMEGEMIW